MIAAILQAATRYFGPGANVVRWITFPIAVIVGTCGYYLEKKYSKKKELDYLDKSTIDQRMARQMEEYQKKRMHRISSSIVEHGTARLVFHEPSYCLKGILLNNEGASFSLNGHMAGRKSNPVLSESIRKMRITIVDDETGERFCIEDVIVNLTEQEGNGGPKNPKISIESPAIKFRTEEILIGMRADVEIRRYLDPSDPLMRTNGEKSPERRVVHIGKMQLRVIASQQRAANPARRTSISQPDESVIEWVQNDFLV